MTLKKQNSKDIPPPPGPGASWEEQAAYFEKYGVDDLLAAGHLQRLMEQDQVSATGRKQESSQTSRRRASKSRRQLNLSLDDYQLECFLQVAERRHIPASTLAKAWLLERLEQELQSWS